MSLLKKLFSIGGSNTALIIPPTFTKQLNIKQNDHVTLTLNQNHIIIRKATKKEVRNNEDETN